MAICEGTDTANQNAKLFQRFIKVIRKDYIVKRQRCFAIITWEFRRSKNKQPAKVLSSEKYEKR